MMMFNYVAVIIAISEPRSCSLVTSTVWKLVWLIVTLNSTEVQNPRRKLDVFSSVLACAKSDHVFQKLSYSLHGLCLSLSSL